MSAIKQNFYSALGGLWNIPDPTSESSTPLDQILVIGTPSSTEVTFGFEIQGKKLAITVKGNFQLSSATPPKNLLEAKASAFGGTVTEQYFTLDGVMVGREQFSPAVSFEDFDLAETDKAAASRLYSGNDTFIGATDTPADGDTDTIDGFAGNDIFYGNGVGQWDDCFYGGAGIDTSVLRGKMSNYTISAGNGLWNSYTDKGELTGFYVKDKTGLDGQQQVSGIERLKFSDTSVALDLNGNAGTAVKILGAVFGKAAATNKEYVGIGIDLLDKGMGYDTLAGLALGAAKATTNDQIVTTLWTNVVGSAPSANDKAPVVKMLEDGMAPGVLARLVAETSFNTTNVNLVGLAQTGIEYTPVV
jgi:hypothetical protein